MNRFDRLFWSRLWTLTRPYWVSEQRLVGDRLRLLRYHHRILELLGDGRGRLGSAAG